MHGTTILAVRKDGRVALAGDGQVSIGDTIVKARATKVRALKGGRILAGFAGSVADALTLFERFEEKFDRYPGNLTRAATELAKDWRADRFLRRLEAVLVVADLEHTFLLSGNGELIEPDDGILAVGSGGDFALAAARALVTVEGLSAREVVERSMKVAGEICVYTNDQVTVLEL
ncbi:MAG: ATP-dependent protease subunit HslV [Gemmatimonadales bacterium]|nr:ATP-dependent protease subunit HslV [Gemmatimonadales bacterium]MDZ4258573.1 ATP-dependent protease subunit HslV [Gemmatimonadales bacterium]MDZ4390476.1 ATP-dependent protease subunit HslV [Gemmatimonadales bacterium]